MPRDSILFIDKITIEMDENDPNCLVRINTFLKDDMERMHTLQKNIDYTDQKIKDATERLLACKRHNQKVLSNMLEIRGGSLDAYHAIVNEISDKTKKMFSGNNIF